MFYIVMEREHHPLAIIGPYTEKLGMAAMESSLIIEDLAQEDCLDCVLLEEKDLVRPDIYEEFVVDPENPHFFGMTDEP